MNPIIKHETNIGQHTTTFRLSGVNTSIANALRRTILSDIHCVAIDIETCVFQENTSRQNTEVLKQRIGQIPVFYTYLPKDMDVDIEKDLPITRQNIPKNNVLKQLHNDESEFIDKYKVVVNVTNNDSQSPRYVTTDDFHIILKNSDEEQIHDKSSTTRAKYVFPRETIGTINKSSYPIDVGRLRPMISPYIPAESIRFTCEFKRSSARLDGGHNMTSMASYTNTLDEEKGARARNEYEIAWKQKNPPPSDGETEEYTNLLDYELKNFDLLNKKRYYKKDSFDYTITSLGVYSVNEIIKISCDHLLGRYTELKDDIFKTNKNNVIHAAVTEGKNFFDVIITDDDYTLSQTIEWGLHYEYILNNPVLKYCAQMQKHPHDTYTTLRLATSEDAHTTVGDIQEMLDTVLLKLIAVYKTIQNHTF